MHAAPSKLRYEPDAAAAAAIIGRCVHCGFCTAACPTYRLTGDELDGPRGRIYLMKRALEGAPTSERTQRHLDRCLTCRACETACPSGVEYGRLLYIGRRHVDADVRRPPLARAVRAMLREVLTRPRLFAAVLGLGRTLRPLLPTSLRATVPPRRTPRAEPTGTHRRQVVLLAGCVQPAIDPTIARASRRVLDAIGIEARPAARAGCCGALRRHLGDTVGSVRDARRNIDAWWTALENGAEAIVIDASGCGASVAEYGEWLQHDREYAAKARRVAAAAVDIGAFLKGERIRLEPLLRGTERRSERIAFHPPCSLQHGLRIRGVVEEILTLAGAELVPVPDAAMCCGSAGTYSLLQLTMARQLRDRKLQALEGAAPDTILSANVGCMAHLAAAARIPVRHWIVWLDDKLSAPSQGAT